jgi:hypothetical protein
MTRMPDGNRAGGLKSKRETPPPALQHPAATDSSDSHNRFGGT